MAKATFDDLLTDMPYGEFCRRSGISTRTLLRLRRGDITRPHPGTLLLIAQALRVPIERVTAALAESRRQAS